MKKILGIVLLTWVWPVMADDLALSNQLFDFAEGKYAKYFQPAGQQTRELQGYLIRYYPGTGTYLGAREGKVYVYGGTFGTTIKYVGEISDFITPATTTGSENNGGSEQGSGEQSPVGESGPVNISNAIFTRMNANCADYAGDYSSAVTDVSRNLNFAGSLSITVSQGKCTFSVNSIPNHDFGEGGNFATQVSAVTASFSVTAAPAFAEQTTALSLVYDNAVMLNGVKLDLLAAACFDVADEKIGCNNMNQPWRFDPMSPLNSFGTDSHNAHTQANGSYHYHGDPNAMFQSTGAAIESPVIGFAADGYPVFGSYFNDSGVVREAQSSYRLKSGSRPSGAGNPGGVYDGTYRDDYEYVESTGDLDECNGMVHDGSYGYYITAAYPWVLGCFRGKPDDSFRKSGP